MKQPSLQAAVVAGLNVLNDPEVRISAAQAEGLVSLRLLLQGLASGQLVVAEPQVAPPSTENAYTPPRKPRKPRTPKGAVNGAEAPAAPAAPATVQ